MPASTLANPLVLGVCIAVAVGVLIYEVVTKNKQKKLEYRNNRPSSPIPSPPSSPKRPPSSRKPPPSSTKQPPSSPKPPTSTSECSSKETYFTGSDNTIRRRRIDERLSQDSSPSSSGNSSFQSPDLHSSPSARETSLPNSNTVIKQKCDQIAPQDKQCNEPLNVCNQNTDNDKFDKEKLFNKNINDTKKENVQKGDGLAQNIDEEDSDSSENNLPKKIENKLINTDVGCLLDEYACPSSLSMDLDFSDKSSYEDQDFSDKSSYEDRDFSDRSSSLDSEEIMYKDKVHNNLVMDLCAGEVDVSKESTSTTIGPVLNVDSHICKGCEENRVNTRAEPCNHRYLCLECATKILRLYNKCSICHSKIREFKLF